MTTTTRSEVDAKTRSIIEAAIRAIAPERKFKEIRMRRYFDRDDKEGLEIELLYEASDRGFDVDEHADMQLAIGDALIEHGDTRFPYLDHTFPDFASPGALSGAR